MIITRLMLAIDRDDADRLLGALAVARRDLDDMAEHLSRAMRTDRFQKNRQAEAELMRLEEHLREFATARADNIYRFNRVRAKTEDTKK